MRRDNRQLGEHYQHYGKFESAQLTFDNILDCPKDRWVWV